MQYGAVSIICNRSTGDVRWEKEQWHAHIVSTDYHPSPAISIGRFIGFKAIMYNDVQLDAKTVVKLEIWVDPDSNNIWHKAYQFTGMIILYLPNSILRQLSV